MPDTDITTLSWVPPLARGLVRNLRIRWALEGGMDMGRTRSRAANSR